jgi:poly(3-hydroxybutyrate) depolymerase
MQHTKALLTLLISCALAVPTSSELVIKERDHKSLAKEIGKYYDAMRESKGILEAYGKVSAVVEKQQKKLKETEILSLVEDWQQVFYAQRAATYSDRGIKKGKIAEFNAEVPGDRTIHYWMWTPQKYSSKKGPYALVLAIPDAGQEPEDLLTADWADAAARENTLIVAPRMPSDAAAWTQFNPSGASLDGISTIMFTYGEVYRKYAVDVNRLFLAGKGQGIAAALGAAQAFPHLFAGVVGRGAAQEAEATNFRNVPTLFLDGGTWATDFEEKVGELGFGNCTHEQGKGEADVWAWIAGQSRNAYPTSLTFRPPTPYSRSCYWLELVGINVDEDPFVEASVDRASNTITIEAENVSSLNISVNDLLVDMEKPVVVVVNGTKHEQALSRNLRVMVDLMFNAGDWGRVFTNRISLDVPAKAE